MRNEFKEVTIKFSPKLAEKFTGKDGENYFNIKVPNLDNNDKTPWAHFVVNPKQVHDDHYVDSCKVIFMPEDGNVTIRREIKTDQLDENGKNIFNKSSDKITVKELEAKFKSNRESVKKKLSEKLSEVEQNKKDTVDKDKSKDKGIGIE